MKYIKFEDVKLSKLSLGTVQFGLDYGIANSNGQPSQDSVNKIISYVKGHGVNCYDTAQAYGNSELVLGKSLKGDDQALVISKLKSDTFKTNTEENIDKSIGNLGLKSLFGLLLHDSELLYKWTTQDSDIVDKIINDGKVKYFGVSIYTSEDFELAIKNEKIRFIQIPFNLFDQRAYREKWFEKAKKHNKLIFIRSIYLQGLLLMNKNDIPDTLNSAKKYIDIIELYAQKLNMTKNELALNFVDSIANDSLILFGCDNLNQAKENIANYNNLKKLDNSTILEISNKLSNIDEYIYNPTMW